jgi:RHS repeat-associated protein
MGAEASRSGENCWDEDLRPERLGKPDDGLENFGARYDSSSMGRFMTPDWSAKPQGVPYAALGDPQTVNLYSYVQNNPLTSLDPDGHEGYLPPPGTVDKPMSETEKQIDLGIIELGSAFATGGATLDAAAAGKITATIVGALATTGFAVSGSSRIMATAAGNDPKKVDEGTTAITTVTNPAGMAVTIATGGNLQAGAVAADVSSAASLAHKPSEAAKDPAGAILTFKGLAQDAKDAYNTAKNILSPPTPPTPPPPPTPLPTAPANNCNGTPCG